MKFTCLRENLAKGVAIVAKAVPASHHYPILTNILLTAKDGRVKLSGTDLATSISIYIGADVEEEGSITIPARTLAEFINNLVVATVTLSIEDDVMHITSTKSKTKINGISASDYPDIFEDITDIPFIEVDPKTFSQGIASVVFSVANDETRPIFSGILMSYSDGKLVLVGSDGYRLSETFVSATGDMSFSVVLPARPVSDIARVVSSLGEKDGKVKIYVDENNSMCLFEAGDILMSSRVLEGAYPDYKRIIPQDPLIVFTFSSSDLLEAVKLTHVFAKDADNILRFALDPNGTLSISSSSQEYGENKSELTVVLENDLDTEFEIVFNAKYLLEFLTNAKYEKFTFLAKTNDAPCLVRPIDIENFLHILAPMQLNK